MPLKNGHLTNKERAFIGYMARTDDAAYSAAKAGYASPSVQGPELARKPDIAAETHRRRMLRLTDLVDPATDLLTDVLTSDDPRILVTHRIDVAKFIVKRNDDLVAQAGVAGKEPSDMTYEELQSAIVAAQVLQRELASNAKNVTPEPLEEQVSPPDLSGVFG